MIEIGIEVSRDAIGRIISDSTDIFTVSWIFSVTLQPDSVVLFMIGIRLLQISSRSNTHKLRFAILYIFGEGSFDCLW